MKALVDCDNFFVSCERTVQPHLIGKAVVVLSNNDGCVVARSREAKALGVKAGTPAFQLEDLINSRRLIAISGHHSLYRDISIRIHDIFRKYVPAAIDYSVDESFLDLDGIPLRHLMPIGVAMREECLKSTGIPVTIGFAPSKALAKVCVKRHKNSPQHIGVLHEESEIRQLLSEMPVQEVWGIGRRLARCLYYNGIYTALQFTMMHREGVRKLLGIDGVRLWLELRGTDCIDLSNHNPDIQKSISETRTFATELSALSDLRAKISLFICDCAQRLRAMKGRCREIAVFLRTNPFHPERGEYYPSASLVLPYPVSDTQRLMQAARRCLDTIFRHGILYKRAGVVCSRIERDAPLQPTLFSAAPDRRPDTLMQAIDRINTGIGRSLVRPAASIIPHDRHSACIVGFGRAR